MGKKVSPPVVTSIKEYETSAYWRAKSRKLLDDKNCECAICHRKRWKPYIRKPGKYKRMIRFSVHHIRYDNVPNEKPEDLMTLCYICHSYCHDILRLRNISEMWNRLAQIVEEYFSFEGGYSNKIGGEEE
jgi:5-methylcytosine-specific restriction endonuclease McrA